LFLNQKRGKEEEEEERKKERKKSQKNDLNKKTNKRTITHALPFSFSILFVRVIAKKKTTEQDKKRLRQFEREKGRERENRWRDVESVRVW
jgi:hypothetical protein